MCDSLTSAVFLGGGKDSPGVWYLRGTNGNRTHVRPLSPGCSVYSLDVQLEAGLVAAGTRAGTIEVLSLKGASATGGMPDIITLAQGSPLLSVCFADKACLVGADDSGRCFTWHPQNGRVEPRPLDTRSATVCALTHLPRGDVVGLTTCGQLLFWSMPEGELVGIVRCPPPPSKRGMTCLRYWLHRNAIVYPTAAGELAVHECQGNSVSVQVGHKGGFYAAMILGNRLVTVGLMDGLLRRWDTDGEAVEEFAAPTEIVAGEALPTGDDQILLIDIRGRATVYTIREEALQEHAAVDGEGYRCAYASPLYERFAELQKRNKARLNQLQLEIESKLSRGYWDAVEPLYAELRSLGATKTELALRAQQAALRNDLIGELSATQQLAQQLSVETRRQLPVFRRYLGLLEELWQPRAALRAAEEAGVEDAAFLDHLRRLADLLDDSTAVVEPGVDPRLLIEAAALTQAPFHGRWVVWRANPSPFPHDGLSPDSLADKFNEVAKDGRIANAEANAQSDITWLTRTGIERVSLVTVEDPNNESPVKLVLSSRVYREKQRDLVQDFAMLVVRQAGNECPVGDHNRRNQAMLERISSESGLIPPQHLLSALRGAFRRLYTRASHGTRQRP
jgi:hypothetical protein